MHVLTLEKLAKDGLLAGKRVLIRSDLNEIGRAHV